MLTEPNFIRVSPQGGGSSLPLVAGLATVGSRTAGTYFHGSGNGKSDDVWSSSGSSDEETYRRDTVGGSLDEGRQVGAAHKVTRNRSKPLLSDNADDPKDSNSKGDAEVKETDSGAEQTTPTSIVFSRDQLLDLADSELTKKAPEDLDSLDPDFAVVIMRQVS